MQFWNEMEGQTLDGLFPLKHLVRAEGRRAWFDTTSPAPQSSPATISVSESLTDADEIESRLRGAQGLNDPNMVAITRIGRARTEETGFVYAVMEHIDQDLGGLLQNRPLTVEETKQVARVLVGALTTIHGQKMFHGRMEPASVLAIEDAIKLRSDCLQSPGGSQAGDITGLGEILFQALTQRKPSSANDSAIERLPAPFAAVVGNALSHRWSLSQIQQAIAPPAAAAPAARSTPASAVPSAVPSPRPPAAPSPSAPIPGPKNPPVLHHDESDLPAASAAARRRLLEEDEEDEPRRKRSVIYVIVAILVAILIAWLIARSTGHAKPPATVPASSVGSTGTRPSALHGSRHAGPATPQVAASRAPSTRATATDPETSHADRSVWHVVAYTYRQRDQAQHKADEVNKAHPGLHARVFVPRGKHNRFLVTVGGSMDRNQAFAMRRRARAAGLPGDTYAQNFYH